MHELSLMTNVVESIRPVAEANGARRVTSVVLEVGEMTEVVREAMEFGFSVLSEGDPLFEGATLTLNYIAPRSRCLACGLEYSHDRFHMACPECESIATTLLEGKDLHIASIEIED